MAVHLASGLEPTQKRKTRATARVLDSVTATAAISSQWIRVRGARQPGSRNALGGDGVRSQSLPYGQPRYGNSKLLLVGPGGSNELYGILGDEVIRRRGLPALR